VRNIFLAGIALLLVGGGVAGYFYLVKKTQAVEGIEAKADREYNQRNYNAANVPYEKLLKEFPQSNQAPKWKLRIKFCEIKNITPNNREEIEKESRLLGEFQREFFGKKEYRDFYKDDQQIHWETVVALVDAAANEAEKAVNPGMIDIANS